MKNIILALSFLWLTNGLFAQQAPTPQSPTVQPKIMVIPYTKEGEDIRTVLDNDPDMRVALTAVKQAFDKRRFTTVDFITKLKAAKDMSIFTTENQSDIKSTLIQFSGADIAVTVDDGGGMLSLNDGTHKSRIALTGNETSTGNSLSNINCESAANYTTDYGALVENALGKCLEEFLNTMNSKFDDIVVNGKSIIVQFGIGAASNSTFSDEINGLPLSDNLEQWMSTNAYKNSYHIQGTSDKLMLFDDVHIPLRDSNGNNYNPNKFALLIYQYLKTLNLTPEKEIKGNTIYITLK